MMVILRLLHFVPKLKLLYKLERNDFYYQKTNKPKNKLLFFIIYMHETEMLKDVINLDSLIKSFGWTGEVS